MTRRSSKAVLAALCVMAVAAFAGEAPQQQQPPRRRGTQKWQQMEYGPFLAMSMTSEPGAKFDNGAGHISADVAPRGLAIRLDPEWISGVVFDMDTLRYSTAWTGAPLNLKGVIFDGAHGPTSAVAVPPTFTTPHRPGWANAELSFADPRKDSIAPLPPPGPLPRAWAKWRGHYRHGERVILSYTVGDAGVLETPSIEASGDARVFVRTINLSRTTRPTAMMVANDKPGLHVSLVGAPSGAEVKRAEGHVTVHLPALAEGARFKVLIGDGGEETRAAFDDAVKNAPPPQDLAPFTKGGPAMWTEPVETKGEPSKVTDQPYVVDRITLPNDNPWKSWIRPGGFDFFPSDPTRAALCTWSGDVWIVTGIDDDLDKLTWKRFATGLHQPLGLKIVDDVIYTVGRDQITRFHDYNNDGEADFYENFNNSWELTTAFHAFCFDLHTDPQGNFVFALGSPVRGGGGGFHNITNHHGTILKVTPDGKRLSVHATGFRAPNGIGVGPNGEVTSGDNEGTFVPTSPLHWVKPGSFNGVVDSAHRDDLKTTPSVGKRSKPQALDPSEAPRPLCWMPRNVDNSGGGQVWVTSDKWGPFQGELLHMSYGTSSLYKVLKEEVNGQVQGGVVKLPVKFTSSAMRARFNPRDGQLYVLGLRGWQSNAAADGGFDRVRYTGQTVQMPTALKAMKTGLAITYTTQLDAQAANDAANYSVEVWNYKWSQNYGSGRFPVLDQTTEPAEKGKKKRESDILTVTSATLQPDGRTVILQVGGMRRVMQMKITTAIKSKDGKDLKHEIHNTIHELAQ